VLKSLQNLIFDYPLAVVVLVACIVIGVLEWRAEHAN
jgi:hypothetical protein